MEEPYRRSIAGDWAGAAREWERRGCPFQTAEALSHADDDLGALRPAARLRAQLRRRGATGVPRDPRRETGESPLDLTPRQHEVLCIVCEGATNVEIAERLVLSPRTVDHHVAAVLASSECPPAAKPPPRAAWASPPTKVGSHRPEDGHHLPLPAPERWAYRRDAPSSRLGGTMHLHPHIAETSPGQRQCDLIGRADHLRLIRSARRSATVASGAPVTLTSKSRAVYRLTVGG